MTNTARSRLPKLDPNYMDEYEEGYLAASQRRSATECPYAFHRTPYYPNATGAFESEYKPKLDAWFEGWKAWLDERGLGFDFEPHRKLSKRVMR